MIRVYVLEKDGSSVPMPRIRCSSELEELHAMLEKNLDLLPGEQINPEAPRIWLLVKREMPVPEVNSGQNRWTIDFFLLDQDATPTFVECKRFSDTRSRRDVVGQVLEYAANAHQYWTKNDMLALASETAQLCGRTLEETLAGLVPEDEPELDEFFERAENNLREGQVRLVFLLDEAPAELKTIVEFLNRQMERTEVLLVEARQYADDQTRIVVPVLFGYSEEARRVKRVVASTGGSRRRKWDESGFFEKARKSLSPDEFEALLRIKEHARSRGLVVDWGTGVQKGSLNVKIPGLTSTSLFTVWSDGKLRLNFGWVKGGQSADHLCQRLGTELKDQLGWGIPHDFRDAYVTVDPSQWVPDVARFLEVLDVVLAELGWPKR